MNNSMLMPSGGPLTLMKLAFQHGGVHPSRIARFLISLIRLSLNYPMSLLERFYFSNQVHLIKIKEAPVFIIGHYRSGTSLMHKLLAADPRFRYISEYELLFPHHSVRVERFLKPMVQRLINAFQIKHPNFNDYTINLNDPNEDEALLVSAGASWGGYWSFIFPSHSNEIVGRSVDFINERDKILWRNSYLYFIKRLHWKKEGRILIKSPASTARIGALLDLFPDAKFIYMHRNPEEVSKSMAKIWRKEILKYFCLQKPHQSTIDGHIQATYHLLLDAYDRDKHLIPDGNLIEVQYEKFLANKFSTVELIYNAFNLSFNEAVKKSVYEKVQMQERYKASRYTS